MCLFYRTRVSGGDPLAWGWLGWGTAGWDRTVQNAHLYQICIPPCISAARLLFTPPLHASPSHLISSWMLVFQASIPPAASTLFGCTARVGGCSVHCASTDGLESGTVVRPQ